MRKALTYLVLVLVAWAWLELQSKGTQGAFGGLLAGWFEPVHSVRQEPTLPPSPITAQVRDRVTGIMSQYERDRERQTRGLR